MPDGEGYDVTLRAQSGSLWAKVVAPESADQNTNYNIEFYSSASGKIFGNGGFPAGVTAVVVPEASKDVYDRVRLIDLDAQSIVLDRALEKPVYTAVLETPVGVTVSRTEESESKDRYTVTGIDLEKYSYELSEDGYGGRVENRESFTIGKDYYGNAETFYVRIFEARESDSLLEEPGFYFSISPYATVALGGSEKKASVFGVVMNGAGAAIRAGSVETRVGADGSFCIDVSENAFDVTVKQPGYLTHTVKNVTSNGAAVELGVITLLAGDTNGDDMINIMDMAAFRQNFGKSGDSVQNAFTDTNGDGMVNIMDMGTFRKNFGKTAAKDCTVEYSA